MTSDKKNKLENDSLQSSDIDAGLGQDAGEFGAGGQGDQNIGHQQRQQHDVDRDASLGMAGESATTNNRPDGSDKND
jgi:hypothetical protein